MAIDLDWSDEQGNYSLQHAFGRPGVNGVSEKLLWDRSTADNGGDLIYSAYLVHFLEYQPEVSLKFRGVRLADGEDIGGNHEIPPGNEEWVWSAMPSTLDQLSPETPYAVLFLTDKYPRVGELALAKGGGKYPPGKPIHKLLELIRRFSEQAQGKTKEEFDEAFKEYLRDEGRK